MLCKPNPFLNPRPPLLECCLPLPGRSACGRNQSGNFWRIMPVPSLPAWAFCTRCCAWLLGAGLLCWGTSCAGHRAAVRELQGGGELRSLPQSSRTARPARLAEIPLIIRTAQEEAQAVTILRELFPATIPQVAGDSGRSE